MEREVGDGVFIMLYVRIIILIIRNPTLGFLFFSLAKNFPKSKIKHNKNN